jgi:5S rRNA maturation endonuclease (ribonuclease M5)
MFEDVEEPFTYPTNLVALSELLEDFHEKYEKIDKRKKKEVQILVDKYNEGAKLYNKIYSELRGSDKKPIYKLIK